MALIWPAARGANAPPPALAEVVEALEPTPKAELPALVAGWLDTLDATGRWALLKLVTGGLRVGVSGPAGQASRWPRSAGRRPDEIEEVWHGARAALPARCSPGWKAGAAARPGARRRCSAR